MSSQSVSKAKTKRTHFRSLSASEIARNIGNFETWSTYQGCDQVSYLDVPKDLRADVDEIFDLTGKMPIAWTDKGSEAYRLLELFASPELLVFIQNAAELCPSLFSDKISPQAGAEIFAEISVVFLAWSRLRSMRSSKEKWSEADFAANVYNLIRNPAVRQSTHRVHCTVSLPQPSANFSRTAEAVRVLNTKTVVPDCGIFIPEANIRSLSNSAKSPFRVLKNHSTIVNAGSISTGSSFRYQSTPCAQLPNNPGFEFASSFWEDKKPLHQMLEDAYRQNRMSTTSAVRHLHSLHIAAPIFGLVWTNGTVRAHVDWASCRDDEGEGPAVLSAPYPGSKENRLNGNFHEWLLDRPSDILQVYFLIRNIDRWTVGKFRERIGHGINDLVEAIVQKGGKFKPWRRVGNLSPVLANVRKENVNTSATVTSSSSAPSPPKTKNKRKRAQ